MVRRAPGCFHKADCRWDKDNPLRSPNSTLSIVDAIHAVGGEEKGDELCEVKCLKPLMQAWSGGAESRKYVGEPVMMGHLHGFLSIAEMRQAKMSAARRARPP